jgi:hypothetical protein
MRRIWRPLLVFAIIGLVSLVIGWVFSDLGLRRYQKAKRVTVREKIDVPRTDEFGRSEAKAWEFVWTLPPKPLLFSLSDKTGSHTVRVDYGTIQIATVGDEITTYTHDFYPSAPSNVEVCDMDLDGIGDVVVFDPGDQVIWILYRNKMGEFSHRQTFGVRPGSGFIEDYNKDGQPDLIVSRPDGGYQVWILEKRR